MPTRRATDSASSGAALSFAAHDIFGNKATVSDPLSDVTLADRYTDRMSAIGDWPGTSWSYTLSGASPAAMIEIDGALQINSYLPAPDLPPGSSQGDGGQDGSASATTPTVVNYTALFDVDNADGVLRPQMTAQVSFVARSAPGVLAVPMAALAFIRLRELRGEAEAAP